MLLMSILRRFARSGWSMTQEWARDAWVNRPTLPRRAHELEKFLAAHPDRFADGDATMTWKCEAMGDTTGGQMGGYLKAVSNTRRTLFIKCDPEKIPLRLLANTLNTAEREVTFYSHHVMAAGSFPILVPRCYFAELAGTRSLLIFDDIVVAGARLCKMGELLSVAQVEQVLTTTLAPLHARYWYASPNEVMPPRMRELVKDTVTVELLSWAAMRRAKRRPELMPRGSEMDRVCDFIRATGFIRVLTALIEQPPLTLIHGDPHMGNIYFTESGQIGLLDWQTWGAGNAMFDVSEFMTTSLSAEDLAASERRLLAAYCDRITALGVSELPVEVALQKLPLFAVYSAMLALLALGLGMADSPRTSGAFHQLWRNAQRATERLGSLQAIQARLFDMTAQFVQR